MDGVTSNSAEQRVLHSSAEGEILVAPARDGKRTLTVKPNSPSSFISRRQITTSYPDDLILCILEAKGLSDVCDEIARDEDPCYVSVALQTDLFAFVPPEYFAGKRVLDFGCGSGASTMVLHRLVKGAEIYGVELDKRLIRVAKARALYYGFPPDHLVTSPDAQTLPTELGSFDVVVLSAVWEHLLPVERPIVMRQIWSLLRQGGIFFLNQTPNRYCPMEVHTTGLPIINYLPDRLALLAARRFSSCVKPDERWESLLRRGIRGGTREEVLKLITNTCNGKVSLFAPVRSEGAKDLIDLWYKVSSEARLRALKRCIWFILKGLKFVTGAQLVPSLTLAVQKEA